MIYLVTGMMRSGTSAMMQALEAGGLPVVKSDERRRLNERSGTPGHLANPVDLYEPAESETQQLGWPRQHDGYALKVVAPLVPRLAVHLYRAVFMFRSPREIQASYVRAFRRSLSLEWIEESLEELQLTLANRRDIITIVDHSYANLRNDPLKVFRGLHEYGWPIDPVAAAAVIHA